jgi:hypothetical protein
MEGLKEVDTLVPVGLGGWHNETVVDGHPDCVCLHTDLIANLIGASPWVQVVMYSINVYGVLACYPPSTGAAGVCALPLSLTPTFTFKVILETHKPPVPDVHVHRMPM